MSAHRPLVTATYEVSPEFAASQQHEAVVFVDSGRLVALAGPAGEPESQRFAKLFAGAQALVDSLDPETLEAIAEEISGRGGYFNHSARADSLRVLARKQRAALKAAGVLP